MINAILVDRDVPSLNYLNKVITQECPDVQVIDVCRSIMNVTKVIEYKEPDVIFMPIEMPSMSCFQFIEEHKDLYFKTVLLADDDKSLMKGIRASAFDYLIKPVLPSEVINVARRLKAEKRCQCNISVKIRLPTAQTNHYVKASDILFFKTDGNYTWVYMKGSEKIHTKLSLKDIMDKLSQYNFVRTHNQYAVNLNAVTKLIKRDYGWLKFEDDFLVPIARSRKNNFLEKLNAIHITI